MNVQKIKNGLVIDHIRAGTGLRIFNWLKLDKAHFSVALIMNVVSDQMGKKDIIKIDNVHRYRLLGAWIHRSEYYSKRR